MKINLDNSSGDDVQIQIVPLIDVIFCILTFFILAALQYQRPQGLNLDLPSARSSTTQKLDRQVITLTDQNQLLFGQSPISREQLPDLLKAYFAENTNGSIVLNASRTAPYTNVIEVLDILRTVSNRVSLATNPATPTPLAPESIPNLDLPGLIDPNAPLNPQINLSPNPTLSPNSSPNPAPPTPIDPLIDPLNPALNPNQSEQPVIPTPTVPATPASP